MKFGFSKSSQICKIQISQMAHFPGPAYTEITSSFKGQDNIDLLKTKASFALLKLILLQAVDLLAD